MKVTLTQLAFTWQLRAPEIHHVAPRKVRHVNPRDHQWRKVDLSRNEWRCDCGAEAWRVGRAMKIRKEKRR